MYITNPRSIQESTVCNCLCKPLSRYFTEMYRTDTREQKTIPMSNHSQSKISIMSKHKVLIVKNTFKRQCYMEHPHVLQVKTSTANVPSCISVSLISCHHSTVCNKGTKIPQNTSNQAMKHIDMKFEYSLFKALLNSS